MKSEQTFSSISNEAVTRGSMHGRMDGFEVGFMEGFREGFDQARKEIARNMLHFSTLEEQNLAQKNQAGQSGVPAV